MFCVERNGVFWYSSFEGTFVNDSAVFVSFVLGCSMEKQGKQAKAKKTVKTKRNSEKAKKAKEKQRGTVKTKKINEEG